MTRRSIDPWSRLLCALALACGSASAATGFAPSRADARLDAVQAGLRAIRDGQNADGSFGGGHVVANTALSVMALLAASTEDQSPPLNPSVVRGVRWLVTERKGTRAGRLAPNARAGYEHGLALMALAEVYGMLDDHDLDRLVGDRIEAGIRVAWESQRANGGWGYTYDGAETDLSVTVMMLNGLRAAEGAGYALSPSGRQRAIDYVRNCQSPRGFSYSVGGNNVTEGANVAGIVSLQVMAGATTRSLASQLEVMGGVLGRRGLRGHGCYVAYYAAQACFQAGGSIWRTQYPAVVRHLLGMRNHKGHWGAGGTLHQTAMAVIALSAPERQLPIYIQSRPKDRP